MKIVCIEVIVRTCINRTWMTYMRSRCSFRPESETCVHLRCPIYQRSCVLCVSGWRMCPLKTGKCELWEKIWTHYIVLDFIALVCAASIYATTIKIKSFTFQFTSTQEIEKRIDFSYDFCICYNSHFSRSWCWLCFTNLLSEPSSNHSGDGGCGAIVENSNFLQKNLNFISLHV